MDPRLIAFARKDLRKSVFRTKQSSVLKSEDSLNYKVRKYIEKSASGETSMRFLSFSSKIGMRITAPAAERFLITKKDLDF